MKLLDFSISDDKWVLLRMKSSKEEYKQLRGNINDLCMFAVEAIAEPTKAIKTGARHSAAKWLLLPVCLRAKYKGLDYNCVRVNCIEYGDMVFFVYALKRK